MAMLYQLYIKGLSTYRLKTAGTIQIKFSSPIKSEHIYPLQHYSRIQPFKFSIGQVDVRTSLYELSSLLQIISPSYKWNAAG